MDDIEVPEVIRKENGVAIEASIVWAYKIKRVYIRIGNKIKMVAEVNLTAQVCGSGCLYVPKEIRRAMWRRAGGIFFPERKFQLKKLQPKEDHLGKQVDLFA